MIVVFGWGVKHQREAQKLNMQRKSQAWEKNAQKKSLIWQIHAQRKSPIWENDAQRKRKQEERGMTSLNAGIHTYTFQKSTCEKNSCARAHALRAKRTKHAALQTIIFTS